MTIESLRQEHIAQQAAAANPECSVWVSANAGAGKTRVLVDRIIRMLLPPYNALPAKILCMTYTKAAAAEMSERLFARLGHWIAYDDARLAKEICELTGETPDQQGLIAARRLFARALETPGGLKIQTIHAFCEHILKRFPVEAKIRADFKILQDADIRLIFQEALDVITSHSSGSDAQKLLFKAVQNISLEFNRSQLLDFLSASKSIYRKCQLKNVPFWNPEALAHFLELENDHNIGDLQAEFVKSIDWDMLAAAQSALADGKKDDLTTSLAIKIVLDHRHADNAIIFEKCAALLLTQKNECRKRLMNNDKIQKFQPIYDALQALQAQFYALFHELKKLDLYHMTEDLSRIMIAIYSYYQDYKEENALFDYDDLIDKTRALLCDSEAASWVLYKLDGGLDHILVDEAQDTSPEQWDIIHAITDEFFIDHEGHRTLFAVGDEKQSIYRFQGADPYQMALRRDDFAQKVALYDGKWLATTLLGSFRSAPAILKLVDHIFQDKTAAKGVQFDAHKAIEHHAVAHKGPGYIRLNAPVTAENEEDIRIWSAPLDQPPPENATAKLAKNVVAQISSLLTEQIILPSTHMPPRPKDIIILVRRRGTLQNLLISELKKQNIPVAGADRLSLLDNIAVLDILAAVQFVLFPEDDLNLAALLKSPLCGITEEELFALAYGRTGTLWSALKANKDKKIFETTSIFLKSLLKRSDFIPPYEFLAMILSEYNGRKKLTAQLGEESIDALDELLSLAMGHDRDHVPSLQSFLHYVKNFSSDIKRDPEHVADEIRIMTVHGAKGLEAPIVFLPDTTDVPDMKRIYKSFELPDGADCPIWIKGDQKSDAFQSVKGQLEEEQDNEYRRLLYVALTRAKDRIYIDGILKKAPSGELKKLSEKCWYHFIREGLKTLDGAVEAENNEHPEYPTYIYSDEMTSEESLELSEANTSFPEASKTELPDWAQKQPFIEEAAMPHHIAPSKAYENDGSQNKNITQKSLFAQKRGTIIHNILEIIPHIAPEKRETLIEKKLLSHMASGALSEDDTHKTTTEIMALIENPEMMLLLSSDGFSEVPITGQIMSLGGISISGQVDRMIITEETIIIADYKSDQALTETSPVKQNYVLQMAFYYYALKELYPDKKIETYIIGTAHSILRKISDVEIKIAIENDMKKRAIRQKRSA
ncbi:MAG: double-strand break repair helicase AddA [Pseudomonadota bacterium]